jgi:hypothetical protein
LDCGGQAQRDPAFARTKIFRITNVSRPPESAVAAPALPAQSKFIHPKLPLAELFAAVEPGSAGWPAAPEIILASFLLNGHGPQCLRFQNQSKKTHGNLE